MGVLSSLTNDLGLCLSIVRFDRNESKSVCTEAYSSSIDRFEGKKSSSSYPPTFYVQDASRRDLRKTFERQGVSVPNEGDFMVLCDSIDHERRGRVRISDVRDKLERGMGVGYASEVSQGINSRTAHAAVLPGKNNKNIALFYSQLGARIEPSVTLTKGWYERKKYSRYQVDVLYVIYDK